MISIKRRSVGDIIANVVIYILLTLIAVSYTLLQRLLRLKRKFKQDRFSLFLIVLLLTLMQEFLI